MSFSTENNHVHQVERRLHYWSEKRRISYHRPTGRRIHRICIW